MSLIELDMSVAFGFVNPNHASSIIRNELVDINRAQGQCVSRVEALQRKRLDDLPNIKLPEFDFNKNLAQDILSVVASTILTGK